MTTNYGPPVIKDASTECSDGRYWIIHCANAECNTIRTVNEDQFFGRQAIICFSCDYDEVHDLSVKPPEPESEESTSEEEA